MAKKSDKGAKATRRRPKSTKSVGNEPIVVLTRAELETLKEDPLCKKVLVPLFQAMGFRDVEFVGGGDQEQGKDIFMWRTNELGDRVNFGVVAKAVPITGKTTTGTVLTQIVQCLGSEHIDRSMTRRKINRCYVVTSCEITKEGRLTIQSLMTGANIDEDRVEFFSGSRVLELLRKHRSQMALLGSMQETYDTLNRSDPDLSLAVTFTPQGTHLGVVPKHDGVLPIKMTLRARFPSTDEGSAKQIEMSSFLQHGTELELDSKYIESIDLPPLMSALMPKGDFKLRFGPIGRKPRLALSATLFRNDVETVRLDFLEMLVSNRGGLAVLSNTQQPVPYHFEIVIHDDGQADVSYSFDLKGIRFEQALRMLDLQHELNRGGRIVFRDLEAGTEYGMTFPEDIAGDPPAVFVDLVRKCVEIAKKIGIELVTPTGSFFDRNDASKIIMIHNAIVKGRSGGDIESITLTAQTPNLDPERLVKSLAGGDGAVTLEGPGEQEASLFGASIPLGPFRVVIPAARIHPGDVSRVAAAGKKPVKLRLISGDKQPITIEYLNWVST